MATDRIFRYLDTVGDGSGTKQATGDYSSTATRFFITNATRDITLRRMIVYLQDGANQRAEYYGALGAALTNGITVTHKDSDGDTILDLTDGIAIKSNGGWRRGCYDASLATWGAGDEILAVRWTFEKAGKDLRINTGESFGVDLNDNFSGLTEHTFQVQGLFVTG